MTRDDDRRSKSFTSTATPDLSTLLELQDGEFVHCAYLTILKREPDADGFRHYAERIRAGAPKIEILSDLCASNEAKGRSGDLPWARDIMRRGRLTRLPIIGVVMRSLFNREDNASLAKRLRLLEQKVFLLERLTDGQSKASADSAIPAHSLDNVSQSEADLSGVPMVTKRVFKELTRAVRDAKERRSV
jgi:Domain of unknown function (DUF4214)